MQILLVLPAEILSGILSRLQDRDKLAFLATCREFWTLRHAIYFTTKVDATIQQQVSYYDRFTNLRTDADCVSLHENVRRLKIQLEYPCDRARKFFDWRILQSLRQLQRLDIRNINTKHGCHLMIPESVTHLRLQSELLPFCTLSCNLRKLICSERILSQIMSHLPRCLESLTILIHDNMDHYSEKTQTCIKISKSVAAQLLAFKIKVADLDDYGSDIALPQITFPKLRKFAVSPHLNLQNFHISIMPRIQRFLMPTESVSSALPETLRDVACRDVCASFLPPQLEKLVCDRLSWSEPFRLTDLTTLSVYSFIATLDMKYVPRLQRLRLQGDGLPRFPKIKNLALACELQTLILDQVTIPDAFPPNLLHLKLEHAMTLRSDILPQSLTHIVVKKLCSQQDRPFILPETVTHAQILLQDSDLDLILPAGLHVLDMSLDLVPTVQKSRLEKLHTVYLRANYRKRGKVDTYDLSLSDVLVSARASDTEADNSTDDVISDTETRFEQSDIVFLDEAGPDYAKMGQVYMKFFSDASSDAGSDAGSEAVSAIATPKPKPKLNFGLFPDVETFLPQTVNKIYIEDNVEFRVISNYDKIRVIPEEFELIQDDFTIAC